MTSQSGGQTAPGPYVLVDLREVTFMDASGVKALASSAPRPAARRLGAAARSAAPGPRVLALTRLDLLMPIYDGLPDAITATWASNVRVHTSATSAA